MSEVFRLRPRLGLVLWVCVILMISPFPTDMYLAKHAWLYALILPAVGLLLFRMSTRRLILTAETLEYRGSTVFSDCRINWTDVSEIREVAVDTRIGELGTVVLLLTFGFVSLLFYGRKRRRLEIETKDFQILRVYDSDLKDYDDLVLAIGRWLPVIRQVGSETHEDDNAPTTLD